MLLGSHRKGEYECLALGEYSITEGARVETANNGKDFIMKQYLKKRHDPFTHHQSDTGAG